MSAFDTQPRPSWWQILRQPRRMFAAMAVKGRGRFNLLVVLLSGIAFFQIWADFFNLADTYPVGKIMSMTLVFGPLSGLLFALLLTVLGIAISNLLDSGHRVAYQFVQATPPFPLKNLLWQRVLGRDRIQAAFRSPALAWLSKIWSGLRSRWTWMLRNLSGGKASMDLVFSGLSAALSVMLFANVFLWLELVFYNGSHFFTHPETEKAAPFIFGLLNFLFIGWFLYLWWTLLWQGFQSGPVRAAISALLSFVLSFALVLLLLNGLFQLPVF